MESGFAEPSSQVLIRKNPASFCSQSHVEAKKSRELRGGTGHVRHHVEDINATSGNKGIMSPPEKMPNRFLIFLVEDAKKEDSIVSPRKRGMTIIARQQSDSVTHLGLLDQLSGDFHDPWKVEHGALDSRKGSGDEDRIGSRPATGIEDFLFSGKVEKWNNRLANAESSVVHGQNKGPCALFILAKMELWPFDGLSRPDHFPELTPCDIDIPIVTDGAAQIGGRPGNKKKSCLPAIPVPALFLLQKTQSHARIKKNPATAAVEPAG